MDARVNQRPSRARMGGWRMKGCAWVGEESGEEVAEHRGEVRQSRPFALLA